ncbi:lysosomal alpha-mannosidase-like [Leptidea sinapis]|uniref:lysosomal alpha-mannosidase-like n=1 Tax=Leptidea sinapis TaxID=189913 RepID=UPI0021C2F4A1|nr:lysosomal alpha-mannosidase-like [Leptidea sinapis]
MADLFIYVETAFFWKWWVRQGDDVRHKVHTLVRQGRLQFVGGAWSMNDEAAAHYQSILDQFTWGLRKLNDTFGVCGVPRVGWQIDPFGHSREFASLLAAMGYDGLFLGRIDYQDKALRLKHSTMEMVWRGDDDLGKSSDLFTGVLYNTYSPPPGFCFDVLCDDEPIVDDEHSPMYNVEQKLKLFISYVKEQSRRYRSNNVIVTMGGDFTYQEAGMWYHNLDKLIEYANLKSAKDGLNITLFYSTPDCYLKAVRDANPTLPIKQDDFFPYASDPTAYWTGYFTSRPTTKYFEREGNDFLQAMKHLQVLAKLPEHNMFVLNELKSAMGMMQHHDAVTGTEKQHVAHDYERILHEALEDSSIIAKQAFNKIVQRDGDKPPLFQYERCSFNESSCDLTERSDQFVVTLYNPLGWKVKYPVRVPVMEGTYTVYAPNGEAIDSQLVGIPDFVKNIPTRESNATHEVVFLAHLHPMGVKSFYVKREKKEKRESKMNDYYLHFNDYFKIGDNAKMVEFENNPMLKPVFKSNYEDNDLKTKEPGIGVNSEKSMNSMKPIDIDVLKDKDGDNLDIEELRRLVDERDRATGRKFPELSDEEMRMLSDEPVLVERDDETYLENEHLKLRFDSSGLLTHAMLPDITFNLAAQFYYWTGCVGNNTSPSERSSGAYIFRPKTTRPFDMKYRSVGNPKGNVVHEMWVESDKNVGSIARLYNGSKVFELDFVVGPIDVSDGEGKEYVIRYETNLLNNGIFYTDSNGRQTLKRVLNKRPQWNLTLEEPIAGNYYPITNEIYIEDNEVRVSILTDRSQGGGSLEEGAIEVMLHRRLLHDDAFGVGEALNETAKGAGLVMRGKHVLLFSNASENNDEFKAKTILELHLPPVVFVADAKHLQYEEWLTKDNCFKGLRRELPDGLHLLTLEPWREKQMLLRLENYKNKSNSSTIEIDLDSLFDFKLRGMQEVMLAANQEIRDKWYWNAETEFVDSFNKEFDSFAESVKAEDVEDVVDDGYRVKLRAKQIRTFIVNYE